MTNPRGGDGGGSGAGGASGDSGPAAGLGEVAEGLAGIAKGVRSMIPGGAKADESAEEAREALDTVGAIGEAATHGSKGLESLQAGVGSGDFSDLGSGVGGIADAARHVVPEGQARDVLAGVGQVARGLGRVLDGAIDLVEGLTGQREEVQFHLEVSGLTVRWHVLSVQFEEAIGTLYSGSIEARLSGDDHVDEEDLLSKDVYVRIERGAEQRSLRGIVRHASVGHRRENLIVHLDIAPALWLLSQTLDSRIYQDVSVPSLVKQVVMELAGSRNRNVRDELTETYSPHEYLVQYRESHWDFLSRLCHEEGIFFYFDHDESAHEVLVLADSNDNRPLVREADEGRIEFEDHESRLEGREVAYHVEHQRRIGPTDAVVRGFDWTNPELPVHHEAVERGEWEGPALEIYDHHHAVRHHGYDDGGGRYRSHSARRQVQVRAQRLDLARSSWTVSTTVVTAKPGHIFELVGADVHDGRYLIVSVNARGRAGGHEGHSDHGGEFRNTLEVIPSQMPYRPPAPARPTMPGPETALVVGPQGEEIHTDQHGRIKVQFHWDRRGDRNEHASAWIRVSQGWAGAGWGMLFIPRVGMEVVVSFLGGDPDRPIVTGCLYNGKNPVPYALPDEKTKSTIKTNSSPNGEGFNELRFEDKRGDEEVFLHAEKDFNEVVKHDHTIRVRNCQRNTVDVDQTETVGRDQTLTVENNREKTVLCRETNKVLGTRHTTVGEEGGDEILRVVNDRLEAVEGARDELRVTTGDKLTSVEGGKWDIKTHGRFQVLQGPSENRLEIDESALLIVEDAVQIASGGGAAFYCAQRNGQLDIKAENRIWIESDDWVGLRAGTRLVLEADTEINLRVGSSVIKMTQSVIELEAPTVKINSTAGVTDISAASQVKIKC